MDNLTVKIKPGNIKSVSNPVYVNSGKIKKVKLSKELINKQTAGTNYIKKGTCSDIFFN